VGVTVSHREEAGTEITLWNLFQTVSFLKCRVRDMTDADVDVSFLVRGNLTWVWLRQMKGWVNNSITLCLIYMCLDNVFMTFPRGFILMLK
jgi:hypothetical protein